MPTNRTRKQRKPRATSVSEDVFRYFCGEFDWDNTDGFAFWEVLYLDGRPQEKLAAWELCREDVLHYLKNRPGSKKQLQKLMKYDHANK